MGISEENIFLMELQLLTSEAMKKHFQWENKDDDKSLFATAQLVFCSQVIESLMESEDCEESDFVDASDDCLQLQYSLLEEARAKNDRKMMIISLARIRIIKTIIRRLGNNERRNRWISGEFVIPPSY
ncbi:hypothetical protein [Geomesophilobacter sediminis]|uniref:Uncharacterized protein n=1 Tax=Geomesophilobacter sediminis TaxID=2798584 RepID=A0A8J7IRL6_9BACT|nr:hypothetical protein [Geomesophilobacter sediminis]MBJ6725599.1 hypothetical protein [Geomesophilobacter sediminis]